MRADAHLHLFSDDDVAAYERLRAEFGIGRGLVVGYEGAPQYEGNNAALRDWAGEHPWIAPLAYAPLDQPPTPDVLDWAVGVSIYADQAPPKPWPAPTIKAFNDRHAVVSINTRPHVIPALRPFLEALDGATVLISHLGLPPPIEPVLDLADLPHVGVKVSGLYAVPGAAAHIAQVADAFGPSRLYWGSDFPPVLDHMAFDEAFIDGPLSLQGASLLAALARAT